MTNSCRLQHLDSVAIRRVAIDARALSLRHERQ
jgi:hypothetical protein